MTRKNLIQKLVDECIERLEQVRDYDACDIEFELNNDVNKEKFFTELKNKFEENNLTYKIDEVMNFSTFTYYYLLVKRTHQMKESVVNVLDESMTYAEFAHQFENNNNFREKLAQAIISTISEAPVGPDGYTLFTRKDIDEWEY